MAFPSNSSAFGAKPATPSIFGGAQQPASTFGGFGTQQSQGQPSQGSSIFGSTLGQPPQQRQQQQQPQQQQPQQQQQGSTAFSGFGQPTQQTGQQSTIPNFFGQSSTNPQQQASQPSTLGTSIFGGTATQNQPTTQQNVFGGFGNLGSSTSGASSMPGQQAGFGNLGASTMNTFQSQANPPPFGTTTTSTNPLFGKQPSQQPQGPLSATQPSGAPLFTRTTKFNDLPDEVKRVFENIESHIQGRVQISNDLKQRKLGEEPLKGQEMIRAVHKDLVNTLSVIQSDLHHTRDLKSKVDQSVQDTIVATRIVDGFRNPQQSGGYLKNHANFPLEFFNRITEEMKERLKWCKSTIEQIERKLSSAASQTQYSPQAITSTLEAQHATFIALASKTATLDAELQKLKALYTQLWRARTGSMRDPFNELDRGVGGDFGIESLSGK